MVSLLDVNLLVALFDADHVHHGISHDWFADHHTHGWATCPVTENGLVRVLATPAYGSAVARPGAILERLRQFCSSKHHVFWPDAVSMRDTRVFNATFIRGHRQITDVYLLAIATKAGGRLATFDQTIPLAAVRGATRARLAVISAATED